MTPVNIELITTDGQPIANSRIQILLPKAGTDTSGTEIALPKKITAETDANGRVTVNLYPATQHPYTLIAADWKTGAKIREVFYVPESAVPVELRDIIQLTPPTNKAYDEAAIQSITQDKIDAQTARTGAEAAQLASELARDASQAAQAASEQARDASVTAQGLSENAQTASEVARDASQAAQGLSETARDASQVAQAGSEAARDLAEQYRDTALTHRTAAETARTGAETAQTASEAARDASQSAQASSEAARDKSQEWAEKGVGLEVEPGKYSSLHHRTQAETAQAASETARDASQTAQGLSESARDASQTAQAAAEAARDLSLQYRNTASSHKDAAAASASAAATSEANADTDAQATAADRVQTGLDADATAADRVQTGLDRTASSDSAAAAAASEASAISARDAAQNSEAASAASEAASAASEAKAGKWAGEAYGVEVEPGLYSAKHWAEESQIAATGALHYRGTWDASTGSFPASPLEGDYYKVSVAGSIGGVEFKVGDHVIYNGTAWEHIDNTESVSSVGGYAGAVTDAQLLAAIKRVHGAGSGLNADTLDSFQASDLVQTAGGEISNAKLRKYVYLQDYDDAVADLTGFKSYIRDGEWKLFANDNEANPLRITLDGNEMWHAGNMPKASTAAAKAGNAGVWPDAAAVHAAFNQYGLGAEVQNYGAASFDDMTALLGTRCRFNGTDADAVAAGLPSVDGSTTLVWWNVDTYGSGNRATQIAVQAFQGGARENRVFFRNKHDAILTPWQELLHTGNMGSGSGLDADTLDGKQASEFQEHILTGADGLAMGVPGNDWNNATASGFYRGSGLPNETPFKASTWQYTMVIEHGGTGYSLQLAKGFYSSDPLSYRVQAGGTWGAWKQVWSEDNHGAGSGLDADLLDGLQSSQFLRADVSAIWHDGADGGLRFAATPDRAYIQGIDAAGTGAGELWLSGLNGAMAPLINLKGTRVEVDSNTVWHAGNLPVQQSTSDTQDGAALLVGAFGLGASGEPLPNNNVDDAVVGGLYYGYTSDHANASLGDNPFTGNGAFTVITVGAINTKYRTQLAQRINNGGGTRVRYMGGTAWSPWKTLWSEDSHGAGSGLDADTVDGVEASSFVRSDQNDTLSGDYTFTGDVIVERNGSQYLKLDQDDTYPTVPGITSFSSPSNAKDLVIGATTDVANTVPTAGNVGISFRVLGQQGMQLEQNLDLRLYGNKIYGQDKRVVQYDDNWLRLNPAGDFSSGIYCGNSVLRTDGQLQVGSNGSTFHVTGTGITYQGNDIWHAGNDGPGSGLNADTVDGLQGSQLVRSDNTGAAKDIQNGIHIRSGGHVGDGGNDYGLLIDAFEPAVSLIDKSTGAGSGQVMFSNQTFYFRHQTLNDGTIGHDASGTVNVMALDEAQFTYMGNTVWHAGNDGPGSGLDADTVDGVQLSQLMRNDVDDQVFPGNKLYWGGGDHNLFDNDGYGNAGIQFGMDKNIMTMDGGAVELQADIDNSSNPAFQLTVYEGGKLTGQTAVAAYVLVGRADGSLTWGGNAIWHAGNDGDGSGLDADLLGGKKVTVSATAPSNPNTNDIWLDIS